MRGFTSNFSNLPPGCTDREVEGPEETDDYGRTRRERIEEEIGERKADQERDEA